MYSPGPTPDQVDPTQNSVMEPVTSWQAQLVDTSDEQQPPLKPGVTDNVPQHPDILHGIGDRPIAMLQLSPIDCLRTRRPLRKGG